MIATIQIRRGTTAEWAAANPILADGEMGIERAADGVVFLRIGDGATHWNDLAVYRATQPQTWRGCCLYLTNTQKATDAVWTTIVWDAKRRDTDSFWSTGANVIIPDGVSLVRLQFYTALDGNGVTDTGDLALTVRRNGGDVVCSRPYGRQVNAQRQVGIDNLEVTGGDVITCAVYSTGKGNALKIAGGTDVPGWTGTVFHLTVLQ